MAFFVYFFIYETKGLTLEEVDEMYEEVKHARHSSKWVPQRHVRTSNSGKEGKTQALVEERES